MIDTAEPTRFWLAKPSSLHQAGWAASKAGRRCWTSVHPQTSGAWSSRSPDEFPSGCPDPTAHAMPKGRAPMPPLLSPARSRFVFSSI